MSGGQPLMMMRNVTAKGSSVSDATPIEVFAGVVEITTAPPGSGVALPFQSVHPGRRMLLQNKGDNNVKIYATSSAGSQGSAQVDYGAFMTIASGGATLEIVHFYDHQWFRPF